MFGNDNQSNQQQDHTASNFGVTTPANQVTGGPLGDDEALSTDATKVAGESTQSAGAPVTEPTTSPHLDDLLNESKDDDLLNIKRSALQDLSPLVGHIDQTPEEKFRTTMMMIQASDDQSLVKAAYEAAQKITDDKARAQALLDVINEINYFTQQHNS